MGLPTWHYGKLLILWTWGAVLTAILWYVAVGLEPESDDSFTSVLGLTAVGFMFLIPASLSVVTWRWLGGKELRPKEGSDGANEAPD